MYSTEIASKVIGYEIDFIHVGDGERSGDAIALRYGNVDEGNYFIQVVDGGDLDAGKRLVEHIRLYYGNPRFINAVVCTHADGDHTSGLREVIDAFDVGAVYMNRPWVYADVILPLFTNTRFTAEGLRKRLRGDYPTLVKIENLCRKRGIEILPAFQGQRIGIFTVLSPSPLRYLTLIPQFDRTPDEVQNINFLQTLGLRPFTDQNNLQGLSYYQDMALKNLEGLKYLETMVRRKMESNKFVQESWYWETLNEDFDFNASNESSVVQLGEIDGHGILLTGDAGIEALNEAADYAGFFGTHRPGLSFIQVPHHGSRNNVSPSMLDRLLGGMVREFETPTIIAFASAAKNANHPCKQVINAFIRRGAKVFSTNGQSIRWSYNMPYRGWPPITPWEFSYVVEN